MVRHAAAVVLAVVLSPSWLCAQAAELTVNVRHHRSSAPSTEHRHREAGRGPSLR